MRVIAGMIGMLDAVSAAAVVALAGPVKHQHPNKPAILVVAKSQSIIISITKVVWSLRITSLTSLRTNVSASTTLSAAPILTQAQVTVAMVE